MGSESSDAHIERKLRDVCKRTGGQGEEIEMANEASDAQYCRLLKKSAIEVDTS
jgi:hypothetical protein